jgi:hypothetical protein
MLHREYQGREIGDSRSRVFQIVRLKLVMGVVLALLLALVLGVLPRGESAEATDQRGDSQSRNSGIRDTATPRLNMKMGKMSNRLPRDL